jgi:hypothetical protein
MVTPSRPQPQRNRRPPRRRIVGSIRATLGRGRATLKRMRPINRIRRQATRQAGTTGKDAPGRLRNLRERSVAGIRHLVEQGVTTTRSLPTRAGRQLNRLTRRGRDTGAVRTVPGSRELVDRARAAGSRKTAGTNVDRAAERGPAAAERAAATERRQVEPAKARDRTRRRERQAKPPQATRRQDLKRHTVQQLREQAREAGIKGRSSMTKTSSSRPCSRRRPAASRKPVPTRSGLSRSCASGPTNSASRVAPR